MQLASSLPSRRLFGRVEEIFCGLSERLARGVEVADGGERSCPFLAGDCLEPVENFVGGRGTLSKSPRLLKAGLDALSPIFNSVRGDFNAHISGRIKLIRSGVRQFFCSRDNRLFGLKTLG